MGFVFGAASQIWTGDLILTKDALYLLSYSSMDSYAARVWYTIITEMSSIFFDLRDKSLCAVSIWRLCHKLASEIPKNGSRMEGTKIQNLLKSLSIIFTLDDAHCVMDTGWLGENILIMEEFHSSPLPKTNAAQIEIVLRCFVFRQPNQGDDRQVISTLQ